MNNGWIKIHRKLLDWEWWGDHNTSRLFFYLLLKANHRPKRWRGMVINRGQVLTGRHALAKATGISEQSIRTSLSKLKSTSELTIQSTSQFSIITICNYDSYQVVEDTDQPAHQPASQPTTNQQLTTNKNDKNDKNILLYEQYQILDDIPPLKAISSLEFCMVAIKDESYLNNFTNAPPRKFAEHWLAIRNGKSLFSAHCERQGEGKRNVKTTTYHFANTVRKMWGNQSPQERMKYA